MSMGQKGIKDFSLTQQETEMERTKMNYLRVNVINFIYSISSNEQ